MSVSTTFDGNSWPMDGAVDGLADFKDQDGPVFSAPWEAQAFALVLALHREKLFSWEEWTAQLSQVIASSKEGGGEHYYRHWLLALEQLVEMKGLSSEVELTRRTEQWRQAYLATPHGQAVDLSVVDKTAPAGSDS